MRLTVLLLLLFIIPSTAYPHSGRTDAQERDRYDRLLGYVYLTNGKMLNEEIVKAGYANVMTIPPNVKYKDRFLKAYREAREKERGLWAK